MNFEAFNNKRNLARSLDSQAEHLKRAAHQLALLEECHAKILEHLGGRTEPYIVNFDSVLFSSYEKPEFHWAWATAGLQQWLGRNAQIAMEVKKPLVCRYVLVPTVQSIENSYWRQCLAQIVAFNVHLSLWHGVIVCVLMIDPRKFPPKTWAKAFDVGLLSGPEIAFVMPNVYVSTEATLRIVASREMERTLTPVKEVLNACSQRYWLWYDEENFSGERLKGSRWDAIRDLFFELSAKPFVCPRCGLSRGFTLDHVFPIGGGFPQTLVNFEGICGPCNSAKSTHKPSRDPFAIPSYVPDDLKTPLLAKMLRNAPPWLGTISRPSTVTETRVFYV